MLKDAFGFDPIHVFQNGKYFKIEWALPVNFEAEPFFILCNNLLSLNIYVNDVLHIHLV